MFKKHTWAKKSRGFTLVEMLVVMTILVTVGTVIMGIFVISLQGTKTSNSLQVARENGQYALEQLSKQIKFAKLFNGVVGIDGVLTTDCTLTDEEGDPFSYQKLQITTFDDEVTTFACENTAQQGDQAYYSLTAESQSLTTGEISKASLLNQSAVRVTRCQFTCNQSSITEPQTIGIEFDILYDPAKNATIPFRTSVTPRNN